VLTTSYAHLECIICEAIGLWVVTNLRYKLRIELFSRRASAILAKPLYSMVLLLSCRIRIDLFFFSIFEIALAPSSPILILFNRSFWIPTFSINISERHCKNSWVLHSVSFKGKIYSTQSWKQIYYLYFFITLWTIYGLTWLLSPAKP